MNGPRDQIEGERFKRILYEEILPSFSKAFSTLLYDFLYTPNFGEVIDEYAESMSDVVKTAIEAEKQKISAIKETL